MALTKQQDGYVDPHFDVPARTLSIYAKVVGFVYDEVEQMLVIRVGLWADAAARLSGRKPIRYLEKRIEADRVEHDAVIDPITGETILEARIDPSFSDMIDDPQVRTAMNAAKTVIYTHLKTAVEFSGAEDA